MKIILLALRNLTRQKRRSFLLGGALAFGFYVLTTVNGCAGGVYNGFEKNVVSLATGHIYYSRLERDPETKKLRLLIPGDSIITQAIEEAGIKPQYVIRRTQSLSMGTLIHFGKSSVRGLEGIDWENDPYLVSNLSLVKGSLDGLAGSDGAVIAQSVAKKLGVDIGDRILIQATTITGQQNVEEAEVKAIYHDTAGVFQVSTFLDREFLNRLIQMPPGSYNTLGIFLNHMNQSHWAQERLYASFHRLAPQEVLVPLEEVREKGANGSFQVIRKDSEFVSGSRHLISCLQDEPFFKSFRGIISAVEWGSAVTVYFLLVLVGVGLVNTFRLIVRERQREIGTMRALGMQRNEVLGLFLWEAVLLALLGAFLGFLLGLLTLWVIGLGENLWVLPEVGELAFFLINNRLAWQLNLGVMAVSVMVLVAMVLSSALIPARKAAKLEPAEALRN